jgi:two-component system cell cycle response regulator
VNSLILVAEADPFDLRLLCELCASSGYEVITAADGGAVLDSVARDSPDLLLMEASLPVINGLEVLRILKSDANLAEIPVLLVTAEEDVETRREALELGAEDYISKPFRIFEIQRRIRNALRLRIRERLASSSSTRRVSNVDDIIDALTGAGTSAQLHITLDYEFTRAVRYKHPLGCVVVRVANFQAIAEKLTADSREGILVALADGLRQYIRGVDHLFRSGPEEFTVVLPETGPDGCRVVTGRFRAGAEDMSLFGVAVSPHPRVHVGSACYPDSGAGDAKELIAAARKALV